MFGEFATTAMSLEGFVTGPEDSPEGLELDLVRVLEAPGTRHLRHDLRAA